MRLQDFYHNKYLVKIFPTLVSSLQEELFDCSSVLDLGCGPDSPIQHCSSLKRKVGVEPYLPYLERSQRKGIHDEYLNITVDQIDFPEGSFDAVVILEVLEHMEKAVGLALLERAERIAKKKVIVSTPNGFVPQEEVDGNSWQKHLSGWIVLEFIKLKYTCRGLAGLKLLRAEKDLNIMDDNILVSIRYRPKLFWFIISALSQSLTYRIPSLAFGLFCVKRK